MKKEAKITQADTVVHYKFGDHVMIKDGIYNGITGNVLDIKENIAIINIQIFGQDISVEVEINSIELV